MTEMDLLDALGSARDRYVWDAHHSEKQAAVPISIKRRTLLVAVLILSLLLVGCVAVMLGLNELQLGQRPTASGTEPPTLEDLISLQGWMGTPNYLAAKEWLDFQETYDPDGALLRSADAAGYLPPEDYSAYLCYTPEMVSRIDEICHKYGLAPLGPMQLAESVGDIFSALNMETIFSPEADILLDSLEGYYFLDGSFQIYGHTTLLAPDNPWPYATAYSYRCIQKSAFDTVFLTVGETEAYTQWNYTTAEGTPVLLALSMEKALIIVDQPHQFLTVNILSTQEAGRQMGRKALEALADTFRFAIDPQPVSTLPSEEAPVPETEAEPAPITTEAPALPREESQPQSVSAPPWDAYAPLLARYPDSYYALQDITGDGQPELLLGDGDSFGMIATVTAGKAQFLDAFSDTQGLYLCQGNVIERVAPEPTIHRSLYYRIEGSEAIAFDVLARMPGGEYARTDSADAANGWQSLTEEAYEACLAAYPRIPLEMYPVSQILNGSES